MTRMIWNSRHRTLSSYAIVDVIKLYSNIFWLKYVTEALLHTSYDIADKYYVTKEWLGYLY
jgi:hypothetical protein